MPTLTTSRTAPAPGSWTGYAPIDAGLSEQFRAALDDLREGLRRWRSWSYLAVEEMKNRYRRTVLGPWWLTIQMGIFVTGISLVFGSVLNEPIKEFLPYLALGYMSFLLLSGIVRASAGVFLRGSATLKSTRQPLSGLVLRDITIEFIQFGHNLLLYVPLLIAGLVPLSPKMLIALPIIALIAVNGLFCGLWLGMAVARFRDLEPLINAILGVAIFFSPVLFQLGDVSSGIRSYVLSWNPFTFLISAFRAPLLDAPLTTSYYVGSAIVTLVNVVLGLIVFTRMRSRLPYWVA